MKLYLSSYRIPSKSSLQKLVGKPLNAATVALIPNAKDYYTKRPRDITIGSLVLYMQQIGLNVDVVDLRDFNNPNSLILAMQDHDIIWAMGGNTYMLRYEMKRSGFDAVIKELTTKGIVYAGDSAGALVAGKSIAGVEDADDPTFAREHLVEGLGLIDSVLFPHADDPEFSRSLPTFRKIHSGTNIIELKDSQAVIFDGNESFVVDAD